jgi:hypothetical protein
MADMIDAQVSDILSRNKLMLRHPGAASLSGLYPTSNKIQTSLAETVNCCSKIRIPPSSRNLGASAVFTVSSSSILYNWNLNMRITVPEHMHTVPMWGFRAIQSIEVTISNSMLQSVIISGDAICQYLLLCCGSPEERSSLVQISGAASGSGSHSSSIPLGWLLENGTGTPNSSWGVDMSTLLGPIQFQVTFNSSSAFTQGYAGQAIEPILAFDDLFLSTCDTQMLNAPFQIRNSMMATGGSYNLPSMYLSSVNYTVPGVTTGQETVFQLNSAPHGCLVGILLNIRPVGELTYNTTGCNYFGSVLLSHLSLEYSGQYLYKSDSVEQIRAINRGRFGGDDLTYSAPVNRIVERTYPTDPVTYSVPGRHDLVTTAVAFIPLGYNMRDILRGNLSENLPSYSGSSLTLRFTPLGRYDNHYESPFNTIIAPPQFNGGGGVTYQLIVTYILDSLVTIDSSVVDLVL